MIETTTDSGLRALLELANESDGFSRLAREAASATGEAVEASASAGIRPFLIAALAESDPGLAGRPVLCVAADDRSARDLTIELGAYLAPRRVRLYPSRGTGYESHLAPPPAPRRPANRCARRAREGKRAERWPAGRRRQRGRAREAVPDASLRPAGFALTKGEEVDLGDIAELLAGCGYERCDQVTDRGQFAVRGGILDVFGSTEDRAAPDRALRR